MGVVFLYAGDPAEGVEQAAPLRDLGPAVDLVGEMGYADFQCMIDDPPDLYNYWSADYHADLSDERARRHCGRRHGTLPGPHSQQLIAALGRRRGAPRHRNTPAEPGRELGDASVRHR